MRACETCPEEPAYVVPAATLEEIFLAGSECQRRLADCLDAAP